MASSSDRVFLCHASEDKPRVIELYGHLKRAGLNPWVDREDIPPASDWDQQITRNIRMAGAFVVCLSRSLVAKTGYVQRELDLAFQLNAVDPARMRIIGVRIEECEVPARFRQLPLVDLLQREGVQAVVDMIKSTLWLFTDPRDGQLYRTIKIGGLVWLAENMNYSVEGSRWYADQPANAKPFGRLYTWDAALAACPPGWHLPDVSEWHRLAESVGAGWGESNTVLYDALIEGGSSGFNAVLGGIYDSGGPFEGSFEKLQNGYYWGGSAKGGRCFFGFSAKGGKGTFEFLSDDPSKGMSCRYVMSRG